MLKYRRLLGGLEPLRQDCSIEQTDGIDVDVLLEAHLRRWYLQLLDSAPRHLLAPENIAATVTTTHVGEGYADGIRLTMPAMCRQVFDVQLKGWHHAVEVQAPSECERIISLQQNRFTAASISHPVAVLLPGESGGKAPQVLAFPGTGGSAVQVSVVTAVLDQGNKVYTFDERALETIP